MVEQHVLLSTDARRLMRMPEIGPITASAIIATIGDAKQFRTGRDLAAWLGLTPLNKSSGGNERLGKITKQGDRYIRRLLVVGMTSRAVMVKRSSEKVDLWTDILLSAPRVGEAYSGVPLLSKVTSCARIAGNNSSLGRASMAFGTS